MWTDDYQRNGYAFPMTVLSPDEAHTLRRELEASEQLALQQSQSDALKAYPHMVLPWLDSLMQRRTIVDAIEQILGPDVLVWNTSFFIKEAHSESFVSWHQDLHYWGLDADDEVTAWIALSPATAASGCMRFIAGSHQFADAEHQDTFAEHNLLSRGQELAVQVDEDQAVDVVLEPGQMSLHHGKTFHASHPNRSDDRRIGVAVRYIKPSMAQRGGVRTFATLVRGTDTFGHFEHAPAPQGHFASPDRERAKRARQLADQVLYSSAADSGRRVRFSS